MTQKFPGFQGFSRCFVVEEILGVERFHVFLKDIGHRMTMPLWGWFKLLVNENIGICRRVVFLLPSNNYLNNGTFFIKIQNQTLKMTQDIFSVFSNVSTGKMRTYLNINMCEIQVSTSFKVVKCSTARDKHEFLDFCSTLGPGGFWKQLFSLHKQM